MPSGAGRIEAERHWAVVPAAGRGERLGAPVPKQYLPLCGRTVLEHAVERLRAHPRIRGVVVAIGPGDRFWERLPVARAEGVWAVSGGDERCHSVRNALQWLAGRAAPQDWVLVHDAARPCLRAADLDALIGRLAGHPVGGILALPARDTMKRSADGVQVLATVERRGLWHALTPQMFRLGPLLEALEAALARGQLVTDESQAMELAGHRPVLVEGHADNVKVTHAADLKLAELYLRQQEEECACA